jgi:hypothetical protein
VKQPVCSRPRGTERHFPARFGTEIAT